VNAYAPRPPVEPFAKYWTKFNLANAFQFNPVAQATTWFSGLPGLWVQDAACQSGVAPIYDRSREHLGVSDTGVVQTRRLLLETARNLASDGVKPRSAQDPSVGMVRAVSLTLPAGDSWRGQRELMNAKLDADFGYTP
jgi:hypothetical protein